MNLRNRRCPDAGSATVEHALLTAFIAAVVLGTCAFTVHFLGEAESPLPGYPLPAPSSSTGTPPP
jgi:hypothetical protein